MAVKILFLLLIFFALIVIQTTIRIEILNSAAGNYLPRKDKLPDGNFADGKWRISQEANVRNDLRNVVETFGFLQYFLAPILLTSSILFFLKSSDLRLIIINLLFFLVACVAIYLMLYREYFQSLGY